MIKGKQISIAHTPVGYTSSDSQLESHISGVDDKIVEQQDSLQFYARHLIGFSPIDSMNESGLNFTSSNVTLGFTATKPLIDTSSYSGGWLIYNSLIPSLVQKMSVRWVQRYVSDNMFMGLRANSGTQRVGFRIDGTDTICESHDGTDTETTDITGEISAHDVLRTYQVGYDLVEQKAYFFVDGVFVAEHDTYVPSTFTNYARFALTDGATPSPTTVFGSLSYKVNF